MGGNILQNGRTSGGLVTGLTNGQQLELREALAQQAQTGAHRIRVAAAQIDQHNIRLDCSQIEEPRFIAVQLGDNLGLLG
ncbi:MAG: hypothetical protein KDI56_02205 [Xanthomonadales bacterium]|nr:hypothetical protein [Xanthomonadales bacterium]